MASQVLDAFMVYELIRRLATPFEKTDAYELGIIDEKGKLLRKPQGVKEKRAYTPYHRFIFNVKKMIGFVGIKSSAMTLAGAVALLLRENESMRKWLMREGEYNGFVRMLEDAPANAAGGGNVAGVTGEPPVNKRKKRDPRITKVLRRKRVRIGV